MAAALSPGRGLVAAGALLAGLGLLLRLRWDGLSHPRGIAGLVDLSWLARAPSQVALTVALIGALAWFIRRGGAAAALLAGAVLLVQAWLLFWQWPVGSGVDNGVTLPAATLLAWGVGGLLVDPDQARRVGREAACGVVAAAYLLAVASKLQGSGLGWASGQNLALHISIHDAGGWLSPLRRAVVDSPGLCGLLGVGTLLIEGSSLLFLFERFRRPWALLAVGMHVGISLLMGLHHYEWLLVVLGLALVSGIAIFPFPPRLAGRLRSGRSLGTTLGPGGQPRGRLLASPPAPSCAAPPKVSIRVAVHAD